MKRLLLQLDSDPQPSSFDCIVAHDAGVDAVISHGNVSPGDAQALVQWLRTVHSYSVAVMTKTRPEIIIEGSDDGSTWKPYEFEYKPETGLAAAVFRNWSGDRDREAELTVYFPPPQGWRP